MNKVLVIVAVLLLASAGMAGEYFKWIDKRGVVHFTDIEAKVPEEYRGDVERRQMPIEKQAPSETPREARQRTEESRDKYDRDRDYWVYRATEAKTRLYRAKREYERLLREYDDALEGYRNTTSLAKRDEFQNRTEEIEIELKRTREDIFQARELLEITLPEEAKRAGVPVEWVR